MTDFVIEKYETTSNPTLFKETVHNYANFLKQPLTFEMFVPCDDNGNVLEIPTAENSNNTIDHDTKLMDYNDAKSKVIFKGFCINYENFILDTKHYYIQRDKIKVMWNYNDKWMLYENAQTIEDLIPYNLDLAVSF